MGVGALISLAAWILWDRRRQWVCLLVLSRDLGIFWLGLAGLAFLGLTGVRAAWTRFRSGGLTALISVLLAVAALTAAAVWQLTVQVGPPLDPGPVLATARNSFHITKEILRQQIEVFGTLNTVMPPLVYTAWALLLCVLEFVALAVGTMRLKVGFTDGDRDGLNPARTPGSSPEPGGFGAQGRHILRITIVVPLLSGEILYRNHERLNWFRVTRPALWFTVLAGAVQFVAST